MGNMTKGIEGMQTALEAEAKGKGEALRMRKNLRATLENLRLLWTMPMQTMLILKRPSRLTKDKSELLQPNLMMSKELRNLQGILLLHLRKRPLVSKML